MLQKVAANASCAELRTRRFPPGAADPMCGIANADVGIFDAPLKMVEYAPSCLQVILGKAPIARFR
ncbi:hypothetical protein [Paraburkholderia fungorum]|uniref:hypothetical protein n=1 Tax=Paraburkholderia fungorum TaxID=134537 RepID=UPI000484BE02